MRRAASKKEAECHERRQRGIAKSQSPLHGNFLRRRSGERKSPEVHRKEIRTDHLRGNCCHRREIKQPADHLSAEIAVMDEREESENGRKVEYEIERIAVASFWKKSMRWETNEGMSVLMRTNKKESD
jgi:hypothetical protein